MSIDISFSDEIKQMTTALEEARAELEELQKQREDYKVDAAELRDAISALRSAAIDERLPDSSKGTRIRKLEINDESGRPSRGARRDQIEAICKKLDRAGKSFRTRDVIARLSEIEGDLSDGMKSYTYAVLKTLSEQKTLKKTGRGTWKLS